VDPLAARAPTSHERMSGRPWDASYRADEPAPWDLGEPQPAVVRLVESGAFVGSVLDAGCGVGDNAVFIATHGDVAVVGVDVAETALAIARAKAEARGVAIEFAVADAFALERLGRGFDTVLDSGLFHAFDDEERARYAANLAAVTKPGGTVFVLCFGDEGDDVGPHPVSRSQLHAAFRDDSGWRVVSIEPERIHTNFHGPEGAPAWLAKIRRA
jgi:SAM-dependent methyltransferase